MLWFEMIIYIYRLEGLESSGAMSSDVRRWDPALLPEEQRWFPVLEMCSHMSNPEGDWKSLPHLATRRKCLSEGLRRALKKLGFFCASHRRSTTRSRS